MKSGISKFRSLGVYYHVQSRKKNKKWPLFLMTLKSFATFSAIFIQIGLPSRYLDVQSQHPKQQNNVWDRFKVNKKGKTCSGVFIVDFSYHSL